MKTVTATLALLLATGPVLAAPPTFQTAVGVNVPSQVSAICVRQADNTCTYVSAANPMPTTSTGAATLPANAAQADKQDQQTAFLNTIATNTTAPTQVVGNVAAGAADAGSPVKVGGVYSSTAAITSLTVGNRGDAQLDVKGNLRVLPVAATATPVDTGSLVGLLQSYSSNLASAANLVPLGALGYVWNGTNVVVARGDASGTWIEGNVASGATDAGFPAKMGCVYRATQPTVADGQRVDCQATSRGAIVTVGAQVNTIADASGTITTAATSQQVFAANAARVYLYCQNPITATETLFLNLGAAASTAGGSFELAPGGSMTFSSNVIPTTTVTITAATAGHRYVCKQA